MFLDQTMEGWGKASESFITKMCDSICYWIRVTRTDLDNLQYSIKQWILYNRWIRYNIFVPEFLFVLLHVESSYWSNSIVKYLLFNNFKNII